MKIGCLQFAPQVGDVDNNLNRADAVLNRSQDLDDLDVLVLPELAFTGYNFKSLADIAPYLEPSGSGISALWARTTALKLNCNVVVGYPEKVDVAQKWPTSPEYYNSAIMINSDGETIANYRKSFLYAVDEKWALEGQDGFHEADVDDLGTVAMGICMDINPYKFEAPWHAFEFAFHVLEVQANLVILTMSWLTREEPRRFTQLPHEPDMSTLEYWIQRLEPIIRTDSDDEVIVVFCNRTGIEDDAVYAGTSTVIGVRNGEVNLYGMLGRGVKELLVVDTARQPIAKLIQEFPEHEQVPTSSRSSPIPQPQAPDRPSKRRGEPLQLNTEVPPDAVNDTPVASTPAKGKKARVATPIVRDDLENWDFLPAKQSISSMPSMKSYPDSASNSRSTPKLGLQIPPDAHAQTGSRNLRNAPSSGGPNGHGNAGSEIPTPTAPSPTPSTLRPVIEFPPSITASANVIPPSINVKSGASIVKVKRTDSPVTPPSRPSTEVKTSHRASISEAPPSPPADERLATAKPRDKRERHGKRERTPVAASLQPEKLAEAQKALQTAKGEAARAAKENGIKQLNQEKSSHFSKLRGLDLIDTGLSDLRPGVTPEMKEKRGLKPFNTSYLDPVSAMSADTRMELDMALAAIKPLLPTALPERPPSTKSRNASQTRPQSANGNLHHRRSQSQSQISVPILASPSIFHSGDEASRQKQQSVVYFRPDSAMMKGTPGLQTPAQYRKSHSMTRVETAHNNLPMVPGSFTRHGLSNSSSAAKVAADADAGRPISRGRQPFTKTNPTNAAPNTFRQSEIIPRVAGVAADARQPSGNRRGNPGERVVSSTGPANRTRAHSSTSSASAWLLEPVPPMMPRNPLQPDDEIIAMISLISGSCPVHSSTGSTPVLQNGRPRHSHQQIQTQAEQPGQQQQQEQQQGQQQQGQQRPGQQGQRQGQRQSQQSQQGQRSLSGQGQHTPSSVPDRRTGTAQSRTSQSNATMSPPAATVDDHLYEVILAPHIRDLVESFANQDRRTVSPRTVDINSSRQTPIFDPPTPTAMEFSKAGEPEPAAQTSVKVE